MVFHTHTLQVPASFLCGFQDTSNVVFCDNLPRPHPRSVRPSVRPGTFQQRLDLLGGASYHSPSSSLRYSLARQESLWNLATTSDFDEMLSETFDDIPSPFLHGKRLGGRQGTSCELGRGHCE